MKDEELVSAFKQGDRKGFEVLMDRYQKQLYFLVKSIVINREDAKDITQRAFINAFNKIHRLKKPDRFKSWLFQIGVNMTRDHIKQRKNNVELQEWMLQPNDQTDPARIVAEKDAVQEMRTLIQALPTRQREVVSLRLFVELSFSEIAEMLRIREQTARTNFHFGIKGLRDLLVEREG